ncbi:hypothetical protein [Streptomyces mirabilis]|uniref:hypothetical protein n=1 Tax=Streptomyces mirabilis TaxID=68239 RepID=UPI00399D5CAD
MNTGEQHKGRADERVTRQNFENPAAALAELRARLEAGLVAVHLSKSMLARRARLGRTTVSEAFSSSADAPSAQTVGALAHALRLDPGPLLDLRAAAVGGASAVDEGETSVGRPITEWNPHDLEVHPAAAPPPGEGGGPPASSARQQRAASALPAYVRRPHDTQLSDLVAATAADGRSRMAVLVGSSSTGKTRACWEGVQPLAEAGWRLWHPFDPTRAEAALADLARVGPRTVVWLNETQHYLGAGRGLGERIAASVHGLLTDPERGPVLVLGTLWPEYADAFTEIAAVGEEDPHPQARELLAGRLIHLPGSFDTDAEAAAKALADAGDLQLAHALNSARDGRVAQFLAGAPELLHRYKTASPAARAILDAASDARRLGSGLHHLLPFLETATEDYLTDDEYDALDDNWLEQALADLGRPVHGDLAPLRRIRPRSARIRPRSARSLPSSPAPAYRLADYLEQYGRSQRSLLCPPASFWHAACDHLTAPDDRVALGEAARLRWRLHTAAQLFRAPAEAGHPEALLGIARIHDILDNDQHAETMYERAADAGSTAGMNDWYRKHKRVGDDETARQIDKRAADAGDIVALLRTEAQNTSEEQRAADKQRWKAEQIEEAAAAGYASVVDYLTALTEESWTEAGAARLRQKVNDLGYEEPHGYLSSLWFLTGNEEAGMRMYEAGATASHPEALYRLAIAKSEAGDATAAAALASQAVEAGHPEAAALLAWELENSGELTAAEHWHRHAAEHGDEEHFLSVIRLKRQAHDTAGALAVCREAANTACVDLLHSLNWDEGLAWRDLCAYGLEPDGTPSGCWRPPLLG